MTDETINNVTRMPTVHDRDFYRVNGLLYLYVDLVESGQMAAGESTGVYVPTFVAEEDDLVGLSIDSFRERLALESPPQKEWFLELQQLISLTKRFFDAEQQGRKHRLFKKVIVNISGSGVSFPSDVAYHPGQAMKLSLFFPRFPYTHVSVVADVVRSEKAAIGYEIKSQFRDMSDSLRDEVLKFVNQCQRDELKK